MFQMQSPLRHFCIDATKVRYHIEYQNDHCSTLIMTIAYACAGTDTIHSCLVPCNMSCHFTTAIGKKLCLDLEEIW